MEKRAFTQPVNPLLPPANAGAGTSAGFITETLWTPQAAVDTFFARVKLEPLDSERVDLERAQRRVLSSDIAADDDYPNAPRSAMDGFAVYSAATPGTLAIVGDVRMGRRDDAAVSGAQAMRIPTGGVLPSGSDAVIPIEDVVVEQAAVRVVASLHAGTNVVPAGADMRRGERVLTAGTRIAAPHAGLLAALGITGVSVYRRPVVAVISSGDELTDARSAPHAGQVRDSNRYAVAASLRAMGAEVRHFPIVRDEPGDCERSLAEAIRCCDAVAITGGSSVGERDRVPAAVAALGQPGIVVHGLAIKPGKPAFLGAIGNTPILGLPGNPTSALFVLEAVFARVIAALVGAPAPSATVTARLTQPLRGREGWTWYVPVALSHETEVPAAHPLALQSFSVSLSTRAAGYVTVSDGKELLAGALVTVCRFLE